MSLKKVFIDLVEENFPKGKCKERGEAMVLVGQAIPQILQLIPREREHQTTGGQPIQTRYSQGFNQCRKETLKNMG